MSILSIPRVLTLAAAAYGLYTVYGRESARAANRSSSGSPEPVRRWEGEGGSVDTPESTAGTTGSSYGASPGNGGSTAPSGSGSAASGSGFTRSDPL